MSLSDGGILSAMHVAVCPFFGELSNLSPSTREADALNAPAAAQSCKIGFCLAGVADEIIGLIAIALRDP